MEEECLHLNKDGTCDLSGDIKDRYLHIDDVGQCIDDLNECMHREEPDTEVDIVNLEDPEPSDISERRLT